MRVTATVSGEFVASLEVIVTVPLCVPTAKELALLVMETVTADAVCVLPLVGVTPSHDPVLVADVLKLRVVASPGLLIVRVWAAGGLWPCFMVKERLVGLDASAGPDAVAVPLIPNVVAPRIGTR
jgi:hypothetical protein